MPTIELPSLAAQVRALPAGGAARNRQLHRLIDLHSSTEAAAALHAAAARAEEGAVASLLNAAFDVLGGALADPGLPTNDAAAYDRLREAVAWPEILSLLPNWIREQREVASSRPDTGACTIGTALELWLWTMKHFLTGEGSREKSALPALDELAEALCPLLAARCLALQVAASGSPDTSAEGELLVDLCHVHAARAAAQVGATCAELVFGYRRHLVWDTEGCATCYGADELDDLEALVPGFAFGARTSADIVEADGSHPAKAGPCASFKGLDTFTRLRHRMDGCLTGARTAKDRAAAAIARSAAGTTPSTPLEGRE